MTSGAETEEPSSQTSAAGNTDLRLVVELVPVSPEEAESLAKRQLAAIDRFLARLDQVRRAELSPSGGNLIEAARDSEEVELP